MVVVWMAGLWWLDFFFFLIIIVAKVLGGFDMEFFWDGEFMAMGCGN